MGRVRINTRTGQIRATFTDDWKTGTTLYEVTGARVSGVFTIRIENRLYYDHGRLDPDTPHVQVGFGRPTSKLYERDYERADRPVVNGVQLCGTPVINTEHMREGRLSRVHMSVRRGHGSAPDATAERTRAVVEGLLTHWLTRPDAYALRLATIRYLAMTKATRKHFEDRVKHARQALREAMDQLNAARDRAAEGAVFAAMAPASYDGYGVPETRAA